ncbi:conditioned medium-induced protein 4 [Haloarcula litorea]|uniref:conditioned medium-induced protein 4 n=1 Tax=Haloarcula litorea TaxID=3032579 RepID=UPI0023E84FDE|nr:conditioned medium-induced protein 4 [Halomicroarcula sp. GDY20]
MDEKTEQLRDIFVDVSGEETVTESQEAARGSLTDVDEATVDERLAAVVDRMRERYEFDTTLDDEALVTVVRGFYEGRTDADLADDLGVDEEAVFTARLCLHLVRDDDTDGEFDTAAFRRRVTEDDPSDAALADEFALDEDAAGRYRRVVAAQAAARRVSHRFQSEFEDVLSEAGLSTRMTEGMREDGLGEATEDIDSLDSDADVSL